MQMCPVLLQLCGLFTRPTLDGGKYFILKLTENVVSFHGIEHTFKISYPK